tara:strand:+ start:7798 stop:8106 length:309 start_codon:yes stop_codon:yes gene_type:complete
VKNITIQLSKSLSVDYLWANLIENIGFEKAKTLISQATDLQKMNGIENTTLPVVFYGTGGLALVSFDLLKEIKLLEDLKSNQIIIFNPKSKTFQILHETDKK